MVAGYYILHEGLIGVMGADGLQEYTYSDIDKDVTKTWKATSGWLGITDKYWASTIIPDQAPPYTARFTTGAARGGRRPTRPTCCSSPKPSPRAARPRSPRGSSPAPRRSRSSTATRSRSASSRFELLIDWGWFYFITKPLFKLIDLLYRLFGNFGVSILIVTVLLKLVFFPLANKSYDSMSKMKKVQPEMATIKERFADDKMKQQQEMMELYKREKINPLSGCLPVVIQIPVFFALYKVLFVTIEMRHAAVLRLDPRSFGARSRRRSSTCSA